MTETVRVQGPGIIVQVENVDRTVWMVLSDDGDFDSLHMTLEAARERIDEIVNAESIRLSRRTSWDME